MEPLTDRQKIITATPMKLHDGSWGARVPGTEDVVEGQTMITEISSNTVSMHTDAYGQYHLTEDDATYRNDCGESYNTKADAYRGAAIMGFTHMVDRTFHGRDRHRIPVRYR